MINIQGVSYANGTRLIEQFLQGIDRRTGQDKPAASNDGEAAQ